jgi:hypothetical protein
MVHEPERLNDDSTKEIPLNCFLSVRAPFRFLHQSDASFLFAGDRAKTRANRCLLDDKIMTLLDFVAVVVVALRRR